MAYVWFLDRFPESTYAPDIRDRKETHVWNGVKKRNTRNDYNMFLKDYPDGKHAKDARARLEGFDWQVARKDDSPQAYTVFLKKHPRGNHARDARRRLEEFDWDATKEEDTIEAYENFLAEHPDGQLTKEARATFDQIVFDTSILDTKIRVHRNAEPFFESVSFSSSVGDEVHNPKVKVQRDKRAVSRQRPEEGQYYVTVTLRVSAAANFTVPMKLEKANGELAQAYSKLVAFPGEDATWIKASTTELNLLESATVKEVARMWTVDEQDLEQGKVMVGSKAYDLYLYR